MSDFLFILYGIPAQGFPTTLLGFLALNIPLDRLPVKLTIGYLWQDSFSQVLKTRDQLPVYLHRLQKHVLGPDPELLFAV